MWRVFTLMLALQATHAMAEDASGASRLDSLTDSKFQRLRAAPPCTGGSIPPGMLSVSGQPRVHAPACLVKADAAIQALANGKITVVDTRTASSFDQFRIPGALNISAHALKTKYFLKAQSFVLIDENHVMSELEAVCADLRRNGYAKVSVVDGGLHAWKLRGGAIEGDAAAMRGLSLIRPAELAQELPLKGWVVIDVGNRKNAEAKKYFANMTSIPWPAEGANQKALLSAINGAGSKRVLIFDEFGSSYDGVRERLGPQGRGVLYLDGGLNGYRKYQREQLAMWKQRDEPPKRKGCSA